MKNIFTEIVKRLPKKSLFAIAVVTALVSASAVAHAWFPDRPTYTIQHPADHVTFNSITNNPDEGDERAFFEVKDAANTQPNGFSHTMNGLKDGQELLLRMYVHNNAADNLNGTNFNGKGVAKNTKVRIFLPTATGSALKANAYVSADNAAPKEVSDTINLGSSGLFNLSYEAGSAVQYTNAVPKGMKLSDSIVTSGAPIGYNSLNGVVPGCFQYSSIVTIKVKVHKPSYMVSKMVRLPGQTSKDLKESVTTTPGKAVEWRIDFNNTGSAKLNNVVVLDQIPNGLTVVTGSVKVYNASNPNGYTLPASAVQNNGRQINVNIGNYLANGNAFVVFQTTVPQEKDLKCGTSQSFVNKAYATPENLGTVSDTASVVVKSEKCKTTPPAETTTTTKPGKLIDTGAGSVAGIFAATTIAGAFVHRKWLKSRV